MGLFGAFPVFDDLESTFDSLVSIQGSLYITGISVLTSNQAERIGPWASCWFPYHSRPRATDTLIFIRPASIIYEDLLFLLFNSFAPFLPRNLAGEQDISTLV